MLKSLIFDRHFTSATGDTYITLTDIDEEWYIIGDTNTSDTVTIDVSVPESKEPPSYQESQPTYEELVDEINSLRNMIIDLKTAASYHDDKVIDITKSLYKYEEKIKEVWIEVQNIPSKTHHSLYRHIIRTLAYSIVSLVAVHLPMFLLLGTQSKLLTLPLSFIFHRLKYLI